MNTVETLLKSKNISYTLKGKDILIRCLNPEHEDNNPSCRVDSITGVAHCFSCGWKANIFKHFGILNTSIVKVHKLKQKLYDLINTSLPVKLPSDYIPFNRNFRNISSRTFRDFEAFTTNTEESLVDRVCFPIKDITNTTVAFIGRYILSSANPKYKIFPSGKEIPLYPLIFKDNYKSIVLVEGIFDMLNLYDKGIKNTVCAFGTSTISENNVSNKFLPLKVQGIQKIYIMFDGDKPGVDASTKLKPIIESVGFEVEIIELNEDTDPGELSEDEVLTLARYINEHSNN